MVEYMAEKREESIQDVPISIIAFSQDKLEKLGITDIKGLASKVPNVLINESCDIRVSFFCFI